MVVIAAVAELVDAHVSGACVRKDVGVRLSPAALFEMIFVYAIKSLEHDYIYIGLTNSLDRRIKSHNRSYNYSTKPYAPFELIYTKSFSTRPEARTHEKYLKSTSGKRFLRHIYNGGTDLS